MYGPTHIHTHAHRRIHKHTLTLTYTHTHAQTHMRALTRIGILGPRPSARSSKAGKPSHGPRAPITYLLLTPSACANSPRRDKIPIIASCLMAMDISRHGVPLGTPSSIPGNGPRSSQHLSPRRRTERDGQQNSWLTASRSAAGRRAPRI